MRARQFRGTGRCVLASIFAALLLLAVILLSASAQDEPASPAADWRETEPNDAFDSADCLPAGWMVGGTIGAPGDIDVYRLYGTHGGVYWIDVDAARYGSALDARVCVVGLWNGQADYEDCNDDWNGRDPLQIRALWDAGIDWYVTVTDERGRGAPAFRYDLTVYQPLLVSATTAGTIAGIHFTPADVLAHADLNDGLEKWLMFFDASDVGITRNVTALQTDSINYMLLSFGADQPVAGLGTVTPFDVVNFYPSRLGPDTRGDFEWEVRGARIGLTEPGEHIDALSLAEHYWGISTTGTATVPLWTGELTARDEDVMRLIWESGDDWDEHLFFDGSAVKGLGREDITAASTDDRYAYYVIQGSGRVDGIPLTQNDIFIVDRDWNRALGRYWSGRDHHFPYAIDAIQLLEP